VHRDLKNDTTGMIAIVPLSNLAGDYFGGRFNITSLNVSRQSTQENLRLLLSSSLFIPYLIEY
jgi:hypothetical protein